MFEEKYAYKNDLYDHIDEVAEEFVVELAKEGEWHSVQTYATMFISGEWDGYDDATKSKILAEDDCDFKVVKPFEGRKG